MLQVKSSCHNLFRPWPPFSPERTNALASPPHPSTTGRDNGSGRGANIDICTVMDLDWLCIKTCAAPLPLPPRSHASTNSSSCLDALPLPLSHPNTSSSSYLVAPLLPLPLCLQHRRVTAMSLLTTLLSLHGCAVVMAEWQEQASKGVRE